MNFMEFKAWMKEKNLTMKLEGWSGCIPDTILVFRDGKPVYTGDYYGNNQRYYPCDKYFKYHL